jgi:hypothetical protein
VGWPLGSAANRSERAVFCANWPVPRFNKSPALLEAQRSVVATANPALGELQRFVMAPESPQAGE